MKLASHLVVGVVYHVSIKGNGLWEIKQTLGILFYTLQYYRTREGSHTDANFNPIVDISFF